MSLATNLQDLATRIATECKAIRVLINGNAPNLNALTTTTKTSLVAAINELDAAIEAIAAGGGAAISDGTTSGSTTWSSTKIATAIAAAKSELVNGAGAALDTLNELAAALGNDANFASTVSAALGKRVSVEAQTFTGPEQAQARSNIDAASATQVGDTTTNFVTTFENGLA